MKEIEIKSPKESFLDEMEVAIKKSLPVSWDETKKEKSMEKITANKIKTGVFTAIPMICQNHKCPYKSTCEFYAEKNAPEGEACPYEMGMLRTFIASYIEEFDIDPENWVEVSQIRDLVDIDIQMVRKAKYLAKEDFIQENVIGVDSDGDPVFRKELHPAIEYDDKLMRRKAQALKQMLGTRESRLKGGMATIDSAQSMANLIDKLRKIEKEHDEEVKRKLGIIDVDQYILDNEAQNETSED